MITEEDIIEHYGTKGMKWGVRKKPTSGRVAKIKAGAKKAGQKTLDTVDTYLAYRQRLAGQAFIPNILGITTPATLQYNAVVKSETLAIRAGARAVKRVNTEVQVKKLKRDTRDL